MLETIKEEIPHIRLLTRPEIRTPQLKPTLVKRLWSMMGYTAPPGKDPPNKKKWLKFFLPNDQNHVPTLVPATAIPSAVARYLEK